MGLDGADVGSREGDGVVGLLVGWKVVGEKVNVGSPESGVGI